MIKNENETKKKNYTGNINIYKVYWYYNECNKKSRGKQGTERTQNRIFFLYFKKSNPKTKKTCSIEIVVQGNFAEERDGGKQDARKCIWSSSCSVTF